MLSHGFDWSSYSCEGWAEEFGTSYIMLDGGNSGGEAWSLFGDGYIPHHVVIDHNREVLYTDYGSNISGIMEVICFFLIDKVHQIKSIQYCSLVCAYQVSK